MNSEGKKRVYKIILPKSVCKELDKISGSYYNKIRNKILSMEGNPRMIGCLKLSDSEEYRIRVGSYRILYDIDDDNKIVTIYKIQHRKDVYKKK